MRKVSIQKEKKANCRHGILFKFMCGEVEVVDKNKLASLLVSSERNNRRYNQKLTHRVASIILRRRVKPIKYLGINLTKEALDPYMGSSKTWMREILKDLNKWRNILC